MDDDQAGRTELHKLPIYATDYNLETGGSCARDAT